ncbi:MAG: peptide MFS transporter [Steroidobacter sp.]|nr:peptide MFS transporter [Steroidobacter sp.]
MSSTTASPNAAPAVRPKESFRVMLRQQPPGLYLVAVTEFWERFSYWGMLGLLVLFLTASPATGGFGWSNSEALTLYAIYTGAVFSAPALGGFLASRYFGERACILWGGVAVTAGHFLLSGPALGPWLIEAFTGWPVGQWLNACGIPLGKAIPSAEVSSALASGRCAADAAGGSAVALAYHLQAWTFLLGLVGIVAGTGFIKSTVSSIVGKLYAPGDARREEGFGIFMACIYSGALFSNLVAGTIGELLDWHWGFAVAGIGMAAGLVLYLARHERLLGDIGKKPDFVQPNHVDDGTSVPSHVQWGRIAVALLMSLFVVLYAMSFYQKGGLLNIETKAHVDRFVFGFELPTTWLLSISTLVFIVLTLPAARLWRSLAARHREPDVVAKLAFGLAALACGYGVFALGLAEKAVSADGRFSLWWMVGMYALFALGDLLVWPTQIAAVSRLAPPRHAAFAVGAWYLTIGLGSWLTATTAPINDRYGISTVAIVLMSLCGGAALLLWLARKPLIKLTYGALDTRPPPG